MKKWICGMVALAFLCLSGCSVHTQKTVFAMDTVMDLQVWGKDSEAAQQKLAVLIGETENTWSATNRNSIVGRLNAGGAVVSQDAHDFLQRAEELSKRTKGAFDPRLGGYIRAWGFYDGAYRVPEEAALQQAPVQWDLGGAVKGYTGQQAVQLLETLKVDRAILNLGGNIQTYGEKKDHSPWVIGIQNPDGGNYLGTVSVVGTMAVVTSGDYQRFFEKDGTRYHHILDPETGRPAQSGLRSVTVICADGLTADVFSTALFVMGLEKASDFWRQSEDFEAVFVTDTGKIYATQGAALSGCEYEVIVR